VWELETGKPVCAIRAPRGKDPAGRGRLKRRYDGSDVSPYQLRCVRGVAALEAMGPAEARALLAELAKGPADDALTREARSAVRRGGATFRPSQRENPARTPRAAVGQPSALS
jgi:hypothetical protein